MDRLIDASEVIIDRPAGSAHPRYPDFVVPFDSGYLKAASAMDQGGIDVSLGTLGNRKPVGLVLTLDLGKRHAEIKPLLGCTSEEAQRITAIHNEESQTGILLLREDPPSSEAS